MEPLNFRIVGSLDEFFFSNDFLAFAVGPVGSTKTTAGVMKILYHASRMAPCTDGIRRSRAVWVRNCYDPETEILTPSGWVRFDELDPSSRVATLVDGRLTWEVPKLHYRAHHKGKMIGLRAQGFDLLVTPDHELWASRSRGRAREWGPYERVKAHEMYGKGQLYRMRTTAQYDGGDASIAQASIAQCEFLGFWLAEGSAGIYDIDGRTHYRLNVSQNPREDQYVERLLERCGYRYGVSTKSNGVGLLYALRTETREEKLRAAEFAGYGKAATKRLPGWAKAVDRERARAILHGYQNGDGTFFGAYPGAVARLRTISPRLADDLQHLAVLAGYSATISWRTDRTAPHKLPMAVVTLHHESRHEPVIRKGDWYTVDDYDDMVYCVEVSSGVVLVRRGGKAVWCGQTREQLRDTSIPDFLKWFPDGVYGSYLKSEMKYLLQVGDIECEVLFRGLDDSNDVRRLLSLQASFGILDEFREINSDVFEALQGRLGRYPDGMLVPHRPEWGLDDRGNPVRGCVTDDGQPNMHLWGMSNPPDFDTYWEKLLSDPPKNAHVTIQPSALAPEADWLHFLPAGYYDNLVEGKSEDWVDVYVHAKFGKSLSGQPVHKAFSRDMHVSKSPLAAAVLTDSPLIIGFDCGLNPSAVLGKLFYDGRLLVPAALSGHGIGALRFVRERLKPLLATKFPGQRTLVVIDPAGYQRAQTDEKSVADILKAEGFLVKPARTNATAARVAAVDNFLTRMVDGKPMTLIDAEDAALLVQALAGKYRFKVKKDGQVEDAPEKLHPWSDIADAFQYLCLHVDNGALFGGTFMAARREVKAAPYRWAA